MVSLVFVYVVRHHEGGRFLVWPVLELTHLIFDLISHSRMVCFHGKYMSWSRRVKEERTIRTIPKMVDDDDSDF